MSDMRFLYQNDDGTTFSLGWKFNTGEQLRTVDHLTMECHNNCGDPEHRSTVPIRYLPWPEEG